MQSLRDQLLKAGLVTEEQVTKAETEQTRPSGRRRRRNAKKATGTRPVVPVKMPELSEPNRLALMQAIEEHRVRGDTRGEVEHYFTLRDGRVRRMYVSKEIYGGLVSGRLAIVEKGEIDRHIIVSAEALRVIRSIDLEAVRFHNAH